jgi:hypothetical protein
VYVTVHRPVGRHPTKHTPPWETDSF